jgi:large subunit ribosomal protein L24
MKNKLKRLKIGDQIKIITGEQKGVIGKISAIFPKKSLLIIDGVSPRIKSLKKNEKKELPKFIHSSNVMIWDNAKNQCSRIEYRIVNNEKKRYLKKTGNFL